MRTVPVLFCCQLLATACFALAPAAEIVFPPDTKAVLDVKRVAEPLLS